MVKFLCYSRVRASLRTTMTENNSDVSFKVYLIVLIFNFLFIMFNCFIEKEEELRKINSLLKLNEITIS